MRIYKKQSKTSASEAFKAALAANYADKSNPFLTKNDLASARTYKVYSVLISQSFSDNPTVTILENTLGVDLVWLRTGPGAYEADGLGALTGGKSTVFIQTPSAIATFTNRYPFIAAATISFGFCYITVTSSVGFTAADDGLGEAFLEIRVYE